MRRLIILALLLPVLAVAQVVSYVSAPAATPAGSTLSNGLIAFWKMDETSGTREDAIGDNDLTANGTGGVGYGTGISGNAADFERTESDYLSINDNADLSFGAEDNLTIAAWVKLESIGAYGPIVSKTNGTDPNHFEYTLHLTTAGKFTFGTGNNTNISLVLWGSSSSTGSWYFVCGWYNTTTDSVYIQVNNGTPVRALAQYEPHDGGDVFSVGNWSGTALFMDGLIDDVAIYDRSGNAVTGKAMADSLYNSGNGWRP